MTFSKLLITYLLLITLTSSMENQNDEHITKKQLTLVVNTTKDQFKIEENKIKKLDESLVNFQKEMEELKNKQPASEQTALQLIQKIESFEKKLLETERNNMILMGQTPSFRNMMRADLPLKISSVFFIVILAGSGGNISLASTLFLNIYFILKIIFEKATVVRSAWHK